MATGSPGSISAVVPYFGAKRRMGSKIVEVIGPHRAYWEPFCGSLAVLFAKPISTRETINDLHSNLINLVEVIKNEEWAADLYGRLARTLPSQKLFAESLTYIREHNDGPYRAIDLAYHYFVVSWLGMNGVAGTSSYNTNFCRRFTSQGGDPGGRFQAAVDSIPTWFERLRSVCVYHTDGIEICGKIEDREGTAVYVDPPYLEKGAKYLHDFTQEVSVPEAILDGRVEGDEKRNDHVRLATRLNRFTKTKVVVSYYEHEHLDLMYPPDRWRKLPIAVPKSMVNTGFMTEGRVEAPEVLLVLNGGAP